MFFHPRNASLRILAVLLAVLAPLWPFTDDARAAERVSVQLNWKHQFEFAAFYAAQEQGYYRRAGLDVAIREGGPGVDTVKEVASGRADCGVGTSTLVVDRYRGLPVVALATLMQHSPVGLLALRRHGINSVHDLAGRPVAVDPHNRDEVEAYLLASGIRADRIKLVDQIDWTLDSLDQGLVAAKVVYISNEPYTIRGREHDYLLLTPRSAGIDLFGNTLFCNQAAIAARPAVARAFREATLKGLAHALGHPEGMADLILDRYNSQNKSRDHLLFEAEQIRELTRPDIVEPGYMSPGRWRHAVEVYAGQGKLPRDFDLTGFIYDTTPREPPRWLIWAVAGLVLLLSATVAVLIKLRRLNRQLKREVAERAQAEETIRNLAFYDALTQLPNRRLLLDRLHQAVALSSRSQRHGALLFIDLDHFKMLNDTHGHDMGDQLLVEVARRLLDCVREGDSVARLGGDEFVVMLEELDEAPEDAANHAEIVAEKIVDRLGRPYRLGKLEHRSTASIGIALFRDKGLSVDELLKRGDLAMYQAKASGRDTLRFFDPTMQAAVDTRTRLEAELRRAIQRNEFTLYYQPQVDAAGRVVGAEALARWQHPERGLILPMTFIALAEETGLIVAIGQQLLRQACDQLKAWAADPDTAHLSLSFNISARQFRHPEFVDMFLANVATAGVDPSRLMLEITESLLLDNVDETVARMQTLKAHGIRFSIDDFGTGYSSLAYLKRLPLDELKIDRSFVADIETDENDAAICAAFISLAHLLGLRVVAEGVETANQHYFLAAVHHCDVLQGYLFGKPGPAGEILTKAVARM